MTNKVKLEYVISEFKDTILALEIALKFPFPHLWELIDRIEAEGIDQDDGRTAIAWAVDTEHFGRCYSVSDEFVEAFPNFPVPPSKTDQMTRCVECGGSGCVDCDGSGLVSSYVSPPSIKDLVEEIKSVGVNNHMAIQALVDKYSLLK